LNKNVSVAKRIDPELDAEPLPQLMTIAVVELEPTPLTRVRPTFAVFDVDDMTIPCCATADDARLMVKAVAEVDVARVVIVTGATDVDALSTTKTPIPPVV
jgi:hypothetical protein